MSDDIIHTVENHYKCECGATWDDTWNCGCDDDCPDCGATCSPDETETLPLNVSETLGEFLESFEINGEYKHAPITKDDICATLIAMQELVGDLIEAAKAAEGALSSVMDAGNENVKPMVLALRKAVARCQGDEA